MARHVVAPLHEFPPGTRRLVQTGTRAIVVFNLGGEFFALGDRCPHRGGSLFHGIQTAVVQSREPGEYCASRRGEMVKCPWHGWAFDIRTGQSWCDPGRLRVRQYPVEVRRGTDLVQGPYAAESFPVRIEDDYVILDA